MQVQLTFSGLDIAQAAQLLAYAQDRKAANNVAVTKSSDDEETPAPKKRGRPPKVKEPEADPADETDDEAEDLTDEAEDTTEEADDEDESEDADEEADDEDEEEEKPAKRKGAAKGPPDIKQVLSAFRDYAKQHGRPKAAKILAKFAKDKNVHSIPKAKYKEVLAALG